MDWATHVPLALLRTSENTFLCLSVILNGRWGWLQGAGSALLSRRWSQMVDHLSCGSLDPHVAKMRRCPCLINSLPGLDKGNPTSYCCFIPIVRAPFWELPSMFPLKKMMRKSQISVLNISWSSMKLQQPSMWSRNCWMDQVQLLLHPAVGWSQMSWRKALW